MTGGVPAVGDGPLVSVVAAAHNEEQNLPVLHERVTAALAGVASNWELVLVDDHSSDGTFEVIRALARRDPRVRGIRLSRNRGSHRARLCGFAHTRGACVVGLAADLQDPPELIPDLLTQWRVGYQVVWALRVARPGESAATRTGSSAYRFVLTRLFGVAEIGRAGSSYLLLDRRAVRALGRFPEANPNALALVRWMGFRSTSIPYEQAARLHGESSWTGGRKLAWAWHSVLAFSPRPIRAILFTGAVLMLGGLLAGLSIWVAPGSAAAWVPPTIGVVVLGGLNLVAVGVVGEYLWQTLEQTRGRPRYLIEDTVGEVPPSPVE